jgi:hypothetical protein
MPRVRYYYHPETRTFHEYPPSAVDPVTRVPVVTDRYMEGVCTTDGIDIGSRAKRREYMKITDSVDYDDCKGMWAKAERLRREGDPADRKARRDLIGKLHYEATKNARRKR